MTPSYDTSLNSTYDFYGVKCVSCGNEVSYRLQDLAVNLAVTCERCDNTMLVTKEQFREAVDRKYRLLLERLSDL